MNLTRIIPLCLSLCLLCSCAGADYSESTQLPTEESIASDEIAPFTESTSDESAATDELSATEEAALDSNEKYHGFYEYESSLNPEECSPIDKSLDCEQILLDRAEALHRLMADYMNYVDCLVYEVDRNKSEPIGGQAVKYPITKSEFKTYAEFKALFADSIYGDYFDKVCTKDCPRMLEEDGHMYYVAPSSGYGVDCVETWYLSATVTDYKIVGHFVLLRALEAFPEEYNTPEYLNNVDNYEFYDITVQNVDGKYLLTDCYGSKGYDYYRSHGWLYNKHWADRSLITNPAVKPAFP